MTIPQAIALCQTFSDAYLDYPFGPEWAVMRHGEGGKSFALIYERSGLPCINLKAEPVEVVVLSQAYRAICPGYHMNKRHWLTVVLDDSVPQGLLADLVAQSYRLTLPKNKGRQNQEK